MVVIFDLARYVLCEARQLQVRETWGLTGAPQWMIFCSPIDVDEVWEVIAKATANNELGIAAKVMPRQEDDGKRERVIAIYTVDFRDRKDVERVLRKLRELKLVEARGKAIYYKPGKSPE